MSNIDSTWIESLVDVGLTGAVPLALAMLIGLGRTVAAAGLPLNADSGPR